MTATDAFAMNVWQFLDSNLGLFSHNLVTNKLTWSSRMYDFHGVAEDQGPSIDLLLECLHPEDRPKLSQLIGKGEEKETYYRVLKKDGSLLYVHCRWDILKSENGDPTLVGSCSDVTDLKSLLDGFERRRQEDLSKLLRTVSHEIRNPLQGIISSAQTLLTMFGQEGGDGGLTSSNENSPPPGPVRSPNPLFSESEHQLVLETLDDLMECATHQHVVINDLLDYAVVLQKAKEPNLEPVDVDAVVQSVASMFRNCAKNKGIGLIHTMPPVHRHVLTDRSCVKRILMNLVSNAMKFTSVGSVTIDVSYEETDQELKIEVSDTGSGIPENFKDQLFTTIGLTTSNSEYINGSGLGLSICKTLADSVDGCIMFRDNEPQGTVMRLSIPCDKYVPPTNFGTLNGGRSSAHENNARNGTVTNGSPGLTNEYSLSGCRALIAEDNIINQKVLRRMLESKVSDLRITSDGEEAVAAFERGAFDFCILDWHMPRLNGKEAAIRIRAKDAHVPIIFLTGEIGSGLDGLETQFAPARVLLKPCTAKDLVYTAVQLLHSTPAGLPPPRSSNLSSLPPITSAVPRHNSSGLLLASTTDSTSNSTASTNGVMRRSSLSANELLEKRDSSISSRSSARSNSTVDTVNNTSTSGGGTPHNNGQSSRSWSEPALPHIPKQYKWYSSRTSAGHMSGNSTHGVVAAGGSVHPLMHVGNKEHSLNGSREGSNSSNSSISSSATMTRRKHSPMLTSESLSMPPSPIEFGTQQPVR